MKGVVIMVKVADNGQLFWDFDSLDLINCYNAVELELEKIMVARDIVCDLMLSTTPSEQWESLSNTSDILRIRWFLLFSVSKNLYNLLNSAERKVIFSD